MSPSLFTHTVDTDRSNELQARLEDVVGFDKIETACKVATGLELLVLSAPPDKEFKLAAGNLCRQHGHHNFNKGDAELRQGPQRVLQTGRARRHFCVEQHNCQLECAKRPP